MTEISLRIEAWSAWAPGLDTVQAWCAWAQDPFLPPVEGQAAAARVAPMLRRRLDPLGRAALQVAIEAMEGAAPDAAVFVSRRGDSERSLELLCAAQRGEGLSPTGFGLSVHNAIAAQYSLTHGQHNAYSALAAGCEGVENGLLEIAAQLADAPAARALLVVYDGPVPEPYQRFRDEPDARYAWALRLSLVGPGRRLRLRLPDASVAAPAPVQTAGELPQALALLLRLLGPNAGWSSGASEAPWWWRLDD